MEAFKCNMWLISILTISYIYGCVGEEEALFTNKPPNIELTDINKMAIFEVNTQIASTGVEDSSTLLDQTTYATATLATDATDRDNITETTTIAGSDMGSEIADDWDLLDEGYLDGDNFDLDELAMADYDSYANNDTEDVSIKEMLKMNLSDEKLKGIMIIQDWLNNEKESTDDGEITTTEFSEDKYDEYLKTFNYDNIEEDLLNEDNFNTERTEAIPEVKFETTTEFATISVQESEITSVPSTTEVPETTTELTTANKSEQVEEEKTLFTTDDEDNVYVTIPTSGKIQDLDQHAEETEEIDALSYSTTESTTISVNEIHSNISNEATSENNHFEESDVSTTTTEAFNTISNEEITKHSDTTTENDEVIESTTEYVLSTTVESEHEYISEVSKSTPTESDNIIQQTTEVITHFSIGSQNKEVTTELIESIEKIEELFEENFDSENNEFTTLAATDNQTETIKDDVDVSDNPLTTQSSIEIQTESNNEFKDEIQSTSLIQTEFSIVESTTDPMVTLKHVFNEDDNINIDDFNATESSIKDDLQDNLEINSTDEPLTDVFSSLEDEAVNNDTFTTTKSVFDVDSQNKEENNSSKLVSNVDEQDIELTTQSNLDATTTVVESMKNNTESEYQEEDYSVEQEGESTNNSLLTTQFPVDVQTEVAKESGLNETEKLEEPEKINIDTVDLEQVSTTSDTSLITEYSLDIQTESEIETVQESTEIQLSPSQYELENQTEVIEVTTEVVNKVTTEVVDEVATEVVDEVTTEVVYEVTTEVVDEVATEVVDEVTTDVVDEVTTKIVELESQNSDIDNSLTTQSTVDVETESQTLSVIEQQTISTIEKLETTTEIASEVIAEEVTNNYDFNSTEEIIVTTQNNENVETVTDKVQEKEFVESIKNEKEVNEYETLSNVANENENKETQMQTDTEDLTDNEYDSLEIVKELINKYNSIETLDKMTESNLQIVNIRNNDLLKEEDFENEEDFIDIMHSSEDKWNANKDRFTTRSSTLVTESYNEDKMFTLSESASEEINPIVVENEMEIESDPISGTTERVEISTSESLYKEPTEQTELNLNNKKQDDDLSAEETEIDKVMVENDLVEDTEATENTISENVLTTEQALNRNVHQEVVTKTVPIEESTMSVVIDESDEADITTLNNVESNEDETRSSTELETVIPIENNGRFIFDLLTSTVTPLSEETTDSPTEELTKDRLSEEKINLDKKMFIADKDIILTVVEKTTEFNSHITTEKSMDTIKGDAVFYNINLKPNSNTERHNILLNLKEESSSSDEILDYLETISEDDDDNKESGYDSEEISNDKLDEIFNYSEEFEETLKEIEEILEESAQVAPYITRRISNNNKEECLSLNMSMSIKINETNIVVPETAKISGNCSEYFLVSWKSAFDSSENNSIYFNLIQKSDSVHLQSIVVHVMKDDGELLVGEANDDLRLDADDTNYIMLNNGLSVQLSMSLKRKNVASAEKPTTLKSTNTLALQITSGIASILILLAVVGVFTYRRLRGQTRILKVTIDK